MTKANLYLVRAENDDGENLDLLVRCETPEKALEFWLGHYGDFSMVTDDASPETLEEVTQAHDELMGYISQVGVINETTEGALPWHDASGYLAVMGRPCTGDSCGKLQRLEPETA